MSHNTKPNVKLIIDNNVNLIDIDFTKLAQETLNYGELNLRFSGASAPEKIADGQILGYINTDRLFISSKNKNSYLELIVDGEDNIQDNNTLLTAQTLLAMHYYHAHLKKDEAVLSKIYTNLLQIFKSDKLAKQKFKEFHTLIPTKSTQDITVLQVSAQGIKKIVEQYDPTPEEQKILADILDSTPLHSASNEPLTLLHLNTSGIYLFGQEEQE